MKKTLFIFFVLLSGIALSQDPHWSQPNAALLYQNPAFTGIQSRFSAGINYRNQWSALNTSFKSYMASADYRFGPSVPKHVALSLGGLFFNDVAGDGKYKTTNAGLTFSCLLKTGARTRLGFGVGFNRVTNSLNSGAFSWGSQYDGIEYNSSLQSGEDENLAQAAYSDLNAGISFAFDERSRGRSLGASSKWFFGYSAAHLNQPELALTGGSQKLYMKHTVFFSGAMPLRNNFSCKPIVLGYRQGVMMEITFGSLFRYSLGEQSRITGFRKGTAFSFGALFRYNDAFVPVIEFEKSNITYGLSYDLNVSKLSNVSNLRGGIEFSIRYNTASYLYNQKPKGGRVR